MRLLLVRSSRLRRRPPRALLHEFQTFVKLPALLHTTPLKETLNKTLKETLNKTLNETLNKP